MRTTILVPNREGTEYGQLNREEKWSNEDFESEEEDEKLKTRFRLIFYQDRFFPNTFLSARLRKFSIFLLKTGEIPIIRRNTLIFWQQYDTGKKYDISSKF